MRAVRNAIAVWRALTVAVIAIAGVLGLGVAAVFTAGVSLAANPLVLIMGGTGTPDPDAEVGYVPNIMQYYVGNMDNYLSGPSVCGTVTCTPQAVITPETAWPLYGGLSAATWQQSILQGSEDFDTALLAALADRESEDDKIVLFGYSQSGAILAIQKQKIAANPELYDAEDLSIMVIGNVSRPNGGLNARLPITIPIVQFPYGPPMPTDTGVDTVDVAMKWDIIADAPLYVLNPLAMLNALMGGPGFGIIHGTYPNPEGNPPTGLIGGYTQEEWDDMMANPENYPDLIDIQEPTDGSDTTYITVTPKILPLVQPLHTIGLKPIADLIEPALRVIIEETGYDRSLPYGTPTTFRLIPIFNPVTLAIDLVPAVQQGVEQFVADLSGASATADTSARLTQEQEPVSAPIEDTSEPTVPLSVVQESVPSDITTPEIELGGDDEAAPATTSTRTHRPFRPLRDVLRNLGIGPRHSTDESSESDEVTTDEQEDQTDDDQDHDVDQNQDQDQDAENDTAA